MDISLDVSFLWMDSTISFLFDLGGLYMMYYLLLLCDTYNLFFLYHLVHWSYTWSLHDVILLIPALLILIFSFLLINIVYLNYSHLKWQLWKFHRLSHIAYFCIHCSTHSVEIHTYLKRSGRNSRRACIIWVPLFTIITVHE